MRSRGRALCFLGVFFVLPEFVLSVSKEAVAHVQCQVCEAAIDEVSTFAKLELIHDEDRLSDLVESLCSVKTREGRWVATYDIVREDADAQLTIQKQDSTGKCVNECLVIQRACQNALRGNEDKVASMLKAGKMPKEMKKKVCKKLCAKTVPKLKHWTDELFSPRDAKEVETEDLIEKMRAETGMGMKMYRREELMGMSEGDMETMAAREAYASERQAARLASTEL